MSFFKKNSRKHSTTNYRLGNRGFGWRNSISSRPGVRENRHPKVPYSGRRTIVSNKSRTNRSMKRRRSAFYPSISRINE